MKHCDDPKRACRSFRTAVSYSQSHGCEIETGGRHGVKARIDGKVLPLPCHPGDYSPGLAHAIYRFWLVAGIAVLVLAIVVARAI